MTKKYAVYPGRVQSRTDGQIHFVDFHALVRLYGVNPEECVDMSRGLLRNEAKSLILLAPRYDGDYRLDAPRPKRLKQSEEILRLRQLGHNSFDKLWEGSHATRFIGREAAYAQLAAHLGITRHQCHFSMFTAEQCEEAIKFARQLSENCDVARNKNHARRKGVRMNRNNRRRALLNFGKGNLNVKRRHRRPSTHERPHQRMADTAGHPQGDRILRS